MNMTSSIYWSLLLLSQLFKPLLGRTGSWGRCWAAIRLSHRRESSGHAVHGEVDELDFGGQHGRRFVLHHTHSRQRRSYPTCTNRSGNTRHRCGGGWAGPRLFLGGPSGGWVPVSGMKMLSLVGLPAHSAFHWWSAQCAAHMLLLSDELIRCAAGTNWQKLLNWSCHNYTSPLLTWVSICAVKALRFKAEIYH